MKNFECNHKILQIFYRTFQDLQRNSLALELVTVTRKHKFPTTPQLKKGAQDEASIIKVRKLMLRRAAHNGVYV
jgi:hypothetical protein